ncbi:hypothetical protein THO17_19490 [Marinomonas sp. THO17]
MAIKKISTGFEVRFRVAGRGSREYKRTFPTKGECERFMRYTISQHETQFDEKPWLEKPKDNRKLSELIDIWDDIHGHFLKDGKRIQGNNLFTFSISAFRRALKRTSIELPTGQASHAFS